MDRARVSDKSFYVASQKKKIVLSDIVFLA